MAYLLFVPYLLFFAWLITKIKFFSRSGLNSSQLVILFFLKVMAGIFYGWMGTYYGSMAQMVDTWQLHEYGLYEYRLLGNDPQTYFTNIFHNPYEDGLKNFFGSTNSYWNDLKANMFVKMLSVFNILSMGQYYINVIFYAFLSFFGPIAFFRVMNDVFPGRKLIILLATFLVPSFLYWTSGIHKEGLLFAGLSLIIYHMYFGWKNGYRFKNWIGIIGGLLLLMIFRNFLVVLVVPAIIAWFVSQKFKPHGLTVFTILYLFFGVLFFAGKHIHPRLDFPQAVVDKQQAFLTLQPGNSTVPITELQPTLGSFIGNTPQAISLTVIRPYPSDVNHLLSLAACFEINLLLLFFLVFLFFRKTGNTSRNTIYCLLFISISILLAIGFSVNNLGAIVRYRSLVIPLLIVPMAAQIDWQRLAGLFSKITNKNNMSIS